MLIEDCHISTGDDAIAIKSGWDQYGYVAALPSAFITVRRVSVWSPGAAGLSVGSEMSGGVEAVLVEDCRVVGAGNGIRIKTGEGRGGYVRK